GAAGRIQAPAGDAGGGPGARPHGGQAAPVRARRRRPATGPRVDRRVRAVLERELRSPGRVRAGPEADTKEEQLMTVTADREIVISRTIDAPREFVFEAFTEVRHLSQWWGPEGFTTTTRAFEFRVGGAWDFVMHGPDGTDYQEWIVWNEI